MADLIALSTRFIDSGVLDEAANRITHELSELGNGIAVVEAFSHSVLFETDEGLLAFDASGGMGGDRVVRAVRGWSDSRFHTLVYTHGHIDHVGGSGYFKADATARGLEAPRVVAHENVSRRFERYELTNYAKPGWESRHNRRYWAREPVLGLGVGAWSSVPSGVSCPYGGRSRNLRSLAGYFQRIEADEPATEQVEIHPAATARGEAVFLALRCREGLLAARFVAWFGEPPRAFFAEAIESLARDGLVVESEAGDLRLTERGRMLADLVGESFVC